jgi:hypothetical protein
LITTLAIAAFLLLSPSAQLQQLESLKIVTDACAPSTIACNSVIRGRLEAGDCTASSGNYLDVVTFTGRAGDYVTLTYRPLAQSLTNPVLTISPPSGFDLETPAVGGGTNAELGYVISAGGTWGVGLSTLDLFGAGDYALELTCKPDPEPTSPKDCVTQTLGCGQAFIWSLTPQSCRFSNSPTTAYAEFVLQGAPNSAVTIDADSTAFRPQVGIWDDRTRTYVGTVTNVSNARSMTTFTFPDSAYYYPIISSRDPQQGGDYGLSVECSHRSCDSPLIYGQPRALTIARGSTVSLQVEVSGSGPLTYSWIQTAPDLQTVGTGSVFTTPPLVRSASYYVRIDSPCGTAQSAPITIEVDAPERRRPVRR